MNKDQAARLLRWSGCAGTSLVWDEGTIRDATTDALKVYSTWPADEGEGHLLAAAPELARWGIEQAEEVERLRAELADLRKKLHDFVLDLSQTGENYRVQYMLTHAEMMDEAADRLVDLLEAKPADERAGGEE